ncbi:transposase [Clostridium sp. Marseille-P299]|uniref:transposase n=1 Tax=Clostridium sp. Marseille-P299 TaxID=1805477 RepID=UPI0008331F2C|nr:transposase [Clostridium sp. Marseille-P299]
MEYLTVKEIGEKWGITSRMVTFYCNENRIDGAIKKGNLWLVPCKAKKPLDKRKNKVVEVN